MSTIVTRSGKGVPLTATDHDNNVNNLNTDKVESLSDLGITATATELNYVDGVTSDIQTQIDGKQATIADDGLSGDKIDGGTISNFTSTGIDDNATSTAITISPGEKTTLKCQAGDANWGVEAYHPTSTAARYIAKFQSNVGGTQVDKVTVDCTGNATLIAGDLIIGTSGKGIDFSADGNAAGSTSEVLDDYEEGTFTPTITFETPGDLSVAYHANTNATYTKVGRLVTISFYVRTTTFSHSTASGNLRILGTPFTPRTYTGMKSEGGTTYYGLNKSGFTQATVLVNSGSSVITMSAVGIAGSSISTVNANDAPGVGGRVDISGVISYETDS